MNVVLVEFLASLPTLIITVVGFLVLYLKTERLKDLLEGYLQRFERRMNELSEK